MGERGRKPHPFSIGKGLVVGEFPLDEGEDCRSFTLHCIKDFY